MNSVVRSFHSKMHLCFKNKQPKPSKQPNPHKHTAQLVKSFLLLFWQWYMFCHLSLDPFQSPDCTKSCCFIVFSPKSHGGHNHSHHHGQGHVHEHKRSHRHAHGHGVQTEGFLEENDPVLKGLVALGGIYVLFIIEHCLRMYKHYNKQKVCAKIACYVKIYYLKFSSAS